MKEVEPKRYLGIHERQRWESSADAREKKKYQAIYRQRSKMICAASITVENVGAKGNEGKGRIWVKEKRLSNA